MIAQHDALEYIACPSQMQMQDYVLIVQFNIEIQSQTAKMSLQP